MELSTRVLGGRCKDPGHGGKRYCHSQRPNEKKRFPANTVDHEDGSNACGDTYPTADDIDQKRIALSESR